MSNHKVLFSVQLEAGVQYVSEMLRHARLADEAGLDFVSIGDHPYFAERLDAYAALGFVIGATSNVTGAVIMTNLLSRPAPILARTVTGLSTISGGRVVLGMGAGGMWEEIVASVSPACRRSPNTSSGRGDHCHKSALRRRRSGYVRWRVLPSH
jgi:alkanesulfonate monooxygenase SsuD/methylene tetrahydromethanopterin reductase-like flavin-dependent oxidoreductase (luciferase family)